MTFQSNPLTSDIITLKNENAIARSIRNIVFTIPGEKFFDESFGSNINRSLFDNIDELSALIIKDQITESIENFEPRVDTVKVVTSPDFDNNSFDVVLTYEIIGADIPPQELQFVLQQTR